MNTIFRIVNMLLLIGILYVLVQIRTHMPPTMKEMMNATVLEKKELMLREPFGLSVDVNSMP